MNAVVVEYLRYCKTLHDAHTADNVKGLTNANSADPTNWGAMHRVALMYSELPFREAYCDLVWQKLGFTRYYVRMFWLGESFHKNQAWIERRGTITARMWKNTLLHQTQTVQCLHFLGGGVQLWVRILWSAEAKTFFERDEQIAHLRVPSDDGHQPLKYAEIHCSLLKQSARGTEGLGFSSRQVWVGKNDVIAFAGSGSSGYLVQRRHRWHVTVTNPLDWPWLPTLSHEIHDIRLIPDDISCLNALTA